MRLIDADGMRENLLWCKEQSGDYKSEYWDDVIERLDVQPTVSGWISVKDRLPDEHPCQYLVVNGGKLDIAIFMDGYWVSPKGTRITHWMPFPELPQGEDDVG